MRGFPVNYNAITLVVPLLRMFSEISVIYASPAKSGIVACPGWEIPRGRMTESSVSARILASRASDQWSTYQTSRANF